MHMHGDVKFNECNSNYYQLNGEVNSIYTRPWPSRIEWQLDSTIPKMQMPAPPVSCIRIRVHLRSCVCDCVYFICFVDLLFGIGFGMYTVHTIPRRLCT